MKKILLSFALIIGLLTSASTLQAQVNMSRYITLTVKSGEAISLDLMAAAAGTPVRIVSGSNTQDITVGTGWYDGNTPSTFTVTADGTEMKVYGDIISFNCSINGANITELDLSHNTQLTSLNCGFNKLTTLDVSQNTQLTSLNCYSNQLTTVDVSQNTQLTELNCGFNKLTTLDVSQNTQLTSLNCGSDQLTTLDVSQNTQLTSLNCGLNKLTTLDVSQNTQLTELNCGFNKLTTLDVSQNTQLTSLNCYSNQLTTLDVSQNTQLTELNCGSNKLNTVDVSQNTQLTELNCGYNQLTTLNVTKNTQLTELYCSSNQFTSLNVTKNTKLKKLICYGNNFSTLDLDRIYCTLPDRKDSTDAGEIYPVYSDTSSNHAIVLATNKANAIAKNWTVQYAKDNADIPATSGTYDCSTAVAEATAEPSLTLYPNPVADVLYLSATARTIRIYNIYGIEIAHATDTDKVEVSHLPAGVYTVKADGTVAKMVKR